MYKYRFPKLTSTYYMIAPFTRTELIPHLINQRRPYESSHCLLWLDVIMTTIFPGSSHLHCRALLEHPRKMRDDNNRIIYDCTVPCQSSDGVIRCSFSHQTFPAAPPVHPGIYELHTKVSIGTDSKKTIHKLPNRLYVSLQTLIQQVLYILKTHLRFLATS